MGSAPIRYCLFFYWKNSICARNKFLWINKINPPWDLRNVPNYFFLWKVNLKDLTSSKIENIFSQLCFLHFCKQIRNIIDNIFKCENKSFSSVDWVSVLYFLNINLIGLRSPNISENKKKHCHFALSIFDVVANLIFSLSIPSLCLSRHQIGLHHFLRNMWKHKKNVKYMPYSYKLFEVGYV